ncbi:MAG: CPBP family intramembrane glutamate endopeptidase, partial [Candidatus Krumholzibacteriia bacterium]
ATSLYNATRGSILLAAVLHFQLMNPIWPDAQPYDTWLLLGVAALVLVIDRKVMFAGSGGLAEV